MPWGAIIGAVGGIIQAGNQSDQAGDAVKNQRETSNRAIDIGNQQYQQTRADLAPWRQAGAGAVGTLAQLLGVPQQSNVPVNNSLNLQQGTIAAYSEAAKQARAELDAEINSNGAASLNEYVTSIPDRSQENVFTQMYLPRYYEELQARTLQKIQQSPYANGQVVEQMRAEEAQKNAGSLQQAQTSLSSSPLLRGFTAQDLQNDPIYQASYQSGLEQGLKALGSSLNSSGMANSGAGAKALARFTADYTSQKGGEAFNRFNVGQTNQYNRLASLAGIGQTSANQTALLGAANAQNVGGLNVGMGNAAAAGAIAQGNAWNQAIGGATNSISNWWNQQQMMQQLRSGTQQPPQWTQTPQNNPYYESGGYQ